MKNRKWLSVPNMAILNIKSCYLNYLIPRQVFTIILIKS